MTAVAIPGRNIGLIDRDVKQAWQNASSTSILLSYWSGGRYSRTVLADSASGIIGQRTTVRNRQHRPFKPDQPAALEISEDPGNGFP